ncbi:MAG: SMP-30/gluconolactonase/LRE family protein [Desulfobacterales bacterium]|nr:MAG: SMP-30/gluconolactonase/LRE family protein [Desulfobacterales bacterium]
MRNFTKVSLIMTLFIVLEGGVFAEDDIVIDTNAAKEFVSLPDGVGYPEGITVNPKSGDIYVSTFDFSGDNKLLRFSKNGMLLAQKDFEGTPLLGLDFNAQDDKVYICNPAALVGGQSKIQRIDADFDDNTPAEDVAEIPIIGAPPDRLADNPDGSQDQIIFGNNAAAPNALIFDSVGNLFVSDSFQGAIFRIDDVRNCPSCPVTIVKHDGLLATAGFPPFGANGLALSADEEVLYVANTGDDRILMLDLETAHLEVFAESINGADGIALDNAGLLWVAANQADKMIVLNEDGRVIAKLGEFLGIRRDGSPRGLLFPASLVISGKWVFVTNLALPLTPAMGDEPEDYISKFTVSRIKNHLKYGLKWKHQKRW